MERDRSFRLWVLAGLAGLAGLAVLHFWTPSDDPRTAICALRRFAGLPCPGCGMTRAFSHLAKGEWAEAFRDHPVAFVLAPEIALAWLAWGAALAGWIPRRRPLWLDTVLYAHLAVLVALWLGRLSTGTLP